MNSQHKAVRALLGGMAPKRAVLYVRSFELPEDEAFCIINCDIRKKSCVQTAMEINLSPDTVKKKRRSAYSKISDAINNA